MNDQFADYETAKMLKHLRFNGVCFAGYDGSKKEVDSNLFKSNKDAPDEHPSAPLWQQVEQWLWEKHEIWMEIERRPYDFRIIVYYWKSPHGFIFDEYFTDPITTKTAGIKQAVKYLHENKRLNNIEP